jgi:glutathione synthase
MARRLGVVMDPIQSIKPAKDSTLAMLLAAARAGFELYYMELGSLVWRDARAQGHLRPLTVADDPERWFAFQGPGELTPLAALDVVLMRKDPPFDTEYIYATYLLEQAERDGVLVANAPRALRDANEKFFTVWFPECCPPTLVGRRIADFRSFLVEQGELVVKPLDTMGGGSVFHVRQGDLNVNVILETLTAHGTRYAMAQRYLPEIRAGDKRILLIDGEPVPYTLARIPSPEDLRGNLAAGGRGEGRPITAREREIAARVGPTLRERGLLFVGLDVIGDYLTEINVTSPTCIRELERAFGLTIADDFIACLERRLAARPRR